jgi:hypothetical protein
MVRRVGEEKPGAGAVDLDQNDVATIHLRARTYQEPAAVGRPIGKADQCGALRKKAAGRGTDRVHHIQFVVVLELADEGYATSVRSPGAEAVG